jgi:hypothetical protein
MRDQISIFEETLERRQMMYDIEDKEVKKKLLQLIRLQLWPRERPNNKRGDDIS